MSGAMANAAEGMVEPVREPSSITRQVIGPNLKVSPSLIGTKLMGTSGMGTTPAMFAAIWNGLVTVSKMNERQHKMFFQSQRAMVSCVSHDKLCAKSM